MKIVFFGTSNVALPILEALSKSHEILAVVTQPDAKVGRKQELQESPVSILATEMKLQVIKYKVIKGNPEVAKKLGSFGADLFVVVSYGQILPKEILEMPAMGCVNVHPSLLPKYRGSTPFVTALLNGETKTGTTIMLMDEKMDEGPIIAQEEVLIEPYDNAVTLGDKLSRVSASLLLTVLDKTANGTIPFSQMPQNASQATYTKILTKEDGKIDWNKTVGEIYNQFRAFYPWPGVWTKWNGKILKLTDCVLADPDIRNESGSTEDYGKVLRNGVVICGNNTFLQIKSLQLEGKKETSLKDFLNGNREFVGSRLE